MTQESFRRLALSLPGAQEHAHMAHPDFRVGRKIFATLWPREGRGVLKLMPAQQEALVSSRPRVFAPAAGAWGARGWTNVALARAEPRSTLTALEFAWRSVAPRKLAEEWDARS